MLSETLGRLERSGLVLRTVTTSKPLRVDYALTPLGRSLRGVTDALCQWSETYADQLEGGG